MAAEDATRGERWKNDGRPLCRPQQTPRSRGRRRSMRGVAGTRVLHKVSLCHQIPIPLLFLLLPPTYAISPITTKDHWPREETERDSAMFPDWKSSYIIQIFRTLPSAVVRPALIVVFWEHSFNQRTHIVPRVSPSFSRVAFFTPTSTYLNRFFSPPFTTCTQTPFTSEALRLYITVTYKFAYIEYIF